MNAAARPSDLMATRPDTIRKRSDHMAGRIVEEVVAGVAAGTLKAGDRLPDERSLCRRYEAGRHTVRKAMDALERQGLVGRFVGRGSFILAGTASEAPEPRPATAKQGWTLLELTEARLLLEPGVAALAVERATLPDLLRLEQMLLCINRADTWRGFKEAKYAFHRAIAEVARNGFVCDIFDRIVASRRQAWDGYQPRSAELGAIRQGCVTESRAILDAFRNGDAEAAAAAVRHSVASLLVSIGNT